MAMEIMYIFDNGNHTMDNYTIGLVDHEGDYVTVCTNYCQSIWSVCEWAIDPNYTDDEPHLGNEIEWSDLPNELQRGLISYFELDDYQVSEPILTTYEKRYGI